MLDQIFNLKFTSKQLVRAARKCEKEEKDEKLKIKKAIEKGTARGERGGAAAAAGPGGAGRAVTCWLKWLQRAGALEPAGGSRGPPLTPPLLPPPPPPPPPAGNMDGAKIYAQNAIRKKNEALNYLRLGSRLDAVVSRLDQQAKMQVDARGRGWRDGALVVA